MEPLSEINIEEKSTIYDISADYFSGRKNKEYEAEITGVVESDGTISLRPKGAIESWGPSGFIFDHSDPDRVITISQMILSFARMAKQDASETVMANETVDTNANA